MPAPEERERLVADKGVLTGRQVEGRVRVGVGHRRGQADGDASDGGRHRADAVEVDHGRERDVHPGHLLHGQDHARQPAARQSGVELHIAGSRDRALTVRRGAVGDGDHQVARKTDDHGALVVLRDVQEHRDVVVALAAARVLFLR